jgi:uncharacterized membrane protein SirB2
MGAARLLAKGWVVFCLYAGALALANRPPSDGVFPLIVCVALFGAMGLLFISGYGFSAGHTRPLIPARINLAMLVPGFNETVFILFTILIFCIQTFYAPANHAGAAADALEGAIGFAVFGQHALEYVLAQCGLGGGRLFASAVSWLLAFIFLASALSRLRLAAALVRLERKRRPEALGAQPLALALGLIAVAGIQFLYIGTAYTLLPCRVLRGLWGDALIGLCPLMLAYAVTAALTNLVALSPEA